MFSYNPNNMYNSKGIWAIAPPTLEHCSLYSSTVTLIYEKSYCFICLASPPLNIVYAANMSTISNYGKTFKQSIIYLTYIFIIETTV